MQRDETARANHNNQDYSSSSIAIQITLLDEVLS